jgi:osmotically-inducible protein OsmY
MQMDTPASNIIKQVSDALDQDPRTRKSIIDVGYNQGVVVLTGMVKSHAVIQAAEEIARSQPGVISVINEMKVG